MSATIPTSEEELAQARASLVYRSQSARETQYLERCIQVVEEAATLAERKRACKAICENCRNNVPVAFKDDSDGYPAGWIHIKANGSRVWCGATHIHVKLKEKP